ncbi:hypothetical protein [Actinomadura miaoliensis]|uniref:Ferredoxin n=1 Tax=Actinomadura miaoliensis TaxID=430685 RepID=A0ABP7WZM6_9ACTN
MFPGSWLPAPDARCRYITEWTAVRLRWRLTVDSAEHTALTRQAAHCPDSVITVQTAD